MFSWVVKVVPQFPEPPGKLGEENVPAVPAKAPPKMEKKVSFQEPKKPAAKPSKSKEEAKEESNGQTGMLTWIANAMPQSPVLARQPSEEELALNRPGVIGWFVHELGKVIPQPDGKHKEVDDADATEVNDLKDVPDAEPLPHIAVVEIVSEEEPEENQSSFPPSVLEWIKQGIEKVVPQPEISEVKKEAPPPPVAPPPPPEPPKPAEEDPKETNVVSRIVQGLGRMLPQPVPRSSGDSSGVVQNRVKA